MKQERADKEWSEGGKAVDRNRNIEGFQGLGQEIQMDGGVAAKNTVRSSDKDETNESFESRFGLDPLPKIQEQPVSLAQ